MTSHQFVRFKPNDVLYVSQIAWHVSCFLQKVTLMLQEFQ